MAALVELRRLCCEVEFTMWNGGSRQVILQAAGTERKGQRFPAPDFPVDSIGNRQAELSAEHRGHSQAILNTFAISW
jgi:hypothetical protein